MTNSPTKASVRCSTCGKRFTRTEHLNRHFRSHTRERPFGCSICGKRFSRTDILHRHEVAHEPEATEKVLRATAGNFRACTKCAAARVKCSGDQPCQRCSTRSINCQYPPMKRRKLSGEAGPDHAIEVATQNVYVEYTAQGASIDEAMAHDTTQVDLPENVPPCEQPSNAVIYQNATAQNLTSLETGQLSPIRRVPHHQLPRSTWSNGSMQSPTGNPIHRQYHDLQNSEDFLLYQNDVQFSNRELSSINWLPLSDSTFENWDFEELGRPIPEESSGHFLSGDVQQPNTARDIMENFEGDENAYQNTTGRSSNDHISPAQTAPVSAYSDSHSASTANQDERSGYYVDGDGGRITTSVRLRRHRSISKDGSSPHSGRNHISNPISSSSHVEQGSAKSPSWITMETYNEIMDQGCTTPFPTISWSNLNLYVQLYFDKFHSLFPILYKRHIGLHRDGWILVLAAATVGAAYGNTLESRQHSEELHEFLHRSLEIHHNFQDGEDQMLELDSSIGQRCENSIMLTQARILNVIGMLHSGNQKLLKFAHSSRSLLTAACNRLDLLRPADHIYLDDILSDDDKQQEWLTEQTRIRTGYFIWMVDCMVAYESDFRPQMKLIDAKAPLPCSDVVWESSDLGKDLIFDSKNEPPTLCIAVEALYMEKKVLPNVSDLGRILIIHAIYHRTWGVYNYHRERLSSWTPTARIESIASIPSQAENWLPSIPAVSRWRNIACDALDILHWSANSVIAAAQGLEPPIVLHLHLSRLILLTPVIQIRRLVSSMLQKSSEQSRSSQPNPLGRKNDIETRNEIWRWISQDQYKARLSIIHAGAIFWNIRRYSYSGPIEPFTIYLATLVIWAYGTFAGVSMRRRRHIESSSGNVTTSLEVMQNEISTTNANISCPPPEYNSTTLSPGRSPSPDPSFLHLDRPIDDDLVQTYVRQGHKMTGNMGRIGDICESSAPAKILREGAKLLNMRERGNRDSSRQDDQYSAGTAVTDGRVTWGVADKFQNLLERLATVVESQDLELEH